MLQDELIQAADRERQLQMQLDKMKDDVKQLQTRLEQLSNVQRNFDDFKERSAPLWEQKMKERDSWYTHYHHHNHHGVYFRQKSIVTLQNKKRIKTQSNYKKTYKNMHTHTGLLFSFISVEMTVDADAGMTAHSQH